MKFHANLRRQIVNSILINKGVLENHIIFAQRCEKFKNSLVWNGSLE